MAPGTCSRNMERSDLKGKSKRKRRRRCKGKGESSSCDCWTLCGKQMMMLTVICGSIQWAWVFFTPLMKFLHRLCFALPLELLHYITSLTASAFRKRCFTIYHSPPAVFVSSRRAYRKNNAYCFSLCVWWWFQVFGFLLTWALIWFCPSLLLCLYVGIFLLSLSFESLFGSFFVFGSCLWVLAWFCYFGG